jgi:hypothetical protein
LTGNQIDNILPLRGLVRLSGLALEANLISDILPLSQLTNIRLLYLQTNRINDISSLAGLTGLFQPFLNNNHISDISPLLSNTGLATGDEIDLRGNLLTAVSLNTYIPQLQSRGVTVYYDTTPAAASVQVNDGNTITLSTGSSRSNIPVAIKNILNLDAGNGVGAFTFTITWNKDVVRVDTLTGATITGWNITPGTPNNTTGSVTIAGFTGTTADIPGGIASFSATASSRAAGAGGQNPGVAPLGAFAGTELLGVREVAPYLGPTLNATTGVFGVAAVASPAQPGNSTLARLVPKLTGDDLTRYTLTVSFQQVIVATGGANVLEDSAKSLTFRRGDANSNGTVDIFDAMFIAQMVVGNRNASFETPSPQRLLTGSLRGRHKQPPPSALGPEVW